GEVALPDRASAPGDLGHGATGADALHELLQHVAPRRLFALLAVLDHQPVLALLAVPGAHAHQRPLALEPLSGEPEDDLAFLEPLVEVADGFPGAAIPQHDRAAAILALGDGAFEAAIGER